MVMQRLADYFIFYQEACDFSVTAEKNAFFPCLITIPFDYDVEKLKYGVK